jgi:glycosyltransferase involved in cell wall biosynthesis
MRLAFFEDLHDGGARRVVYEQAKRLAKEHEILVVTNTLDSYFRYETLGIEVKRFDLEERHFSGLARPLKEITLFSRLIPQFRQAAQFIAEWRAEVVIVHPSRLTQAPMVMPFLDIPMIYYCEEWFRMVYEPKLHPLPDLNQTKRSYELTRRKILAWLDRMAVACANKVVANSEYTARNVKEAYRKKAEVVYPGVDTAVFYPESTTKDYYLFVGAKKDIEGYNLLKRFADEKKVPVKIKIHDPSYEEFTSDQAMRKLYSQAVATLCLAKTEPFGLVAVESMACGTPVIAVNEAGYRETVVHQETGFLIERDHQDLYQAIMKLSQNKELAEKMGKAGVRRAKNVFSWERQIEKFSRVIESLE